MDGAADSVCGWWRNRRRGLRRLRPELESVQPKRLNQRFPWGRGRDCRAFSFRPRLPVMVLLLRRFFFRWTLHRFLFHEKTLSNERRPEKSVSDLELRRWKGKQARAGFSRERNQTMTPRTQTGGCKLESEAYWTTEQMRSAHLFPGERTVNTLFLNVLNEIFLVSKKKSHIIVCEIVNRIVFLIDFAIDIHI